MLIQKFLPDLRQVFRVLTFKIWSSALQADMNILIHDTLFSQAAIYASKLHAKEVNLDHFDWAKVSLVRLSD